MSRLAFLDFTPVPVRTRRDGWSPAVQRRFVLHLARGLGPAEAARRVGLSRQTAYALRARPGGESFAAAWNVAVAFAREASSMPGPPLTSSGLETVLVPRFYRGRLVGFVQREDHRGLIQALRQLDRITDRMEERRGAPRDAVEHLNEFLGAKTDETDAKTL